MFNNVILDSLATFGYFAAAIGVVVCVIAYFAIPKLVQIAFSQEDKNENSES